MEQIKSVRGNLKPGNQQSKKVDSEGLSYVRIDKTGKVIAVFGDDSEVDMSELFTLSITDD